MTVLNFSDITSKFGTITELLTVNIYKRMVYIKPADTLQSVSIQYFAFIIPMAP
jgi:hypothetical protein